jgi:hypothetical protein
MEQATELLLLKFGGGCAFRGNSGRLQVVYRIRTLFTLVLNEL